jgi:hypothetical protein
MLVDYHVASDAEALSGPLANLAGREEGIE